MTKRILYPYNQVQFPSYFGTEGFGEIESIDDKKTICHIIITKETWCSGIWCGSEGIIFQIQRDGRPIKLKKINLKKRKLTFKKNI